MVTMWDKSISLTIVIISLCIINRNVVHLKYIILFYFFKKQSHLNGKENQTFFFPEIQSCFQCHWEQGWIFQACQPDVSVDAILLRSVHEEHGRFGGWWTTCLLWRGLQTHTRWQRLQMTWFHLPSYHETQLVGKVGGENTFFKASKD